MTSFEGNGLTLKGGSTVGKGNVFIGDLAVCDDDWDIALWMQMLLAEC